MEAILPASKVKINQGNNVFRPSSSTFGSAAYTSNQPVVSDEGSIAALHATTSNRSGMSAEAANPPPQPHTVDAPDIDSSPTRPPLSVLSGGDSSQASTFNRAPSTTSSNSKRKFSALGTDAASMSSSDKRSRPTGCAPAGSVAIMHVGNSIVAFGDVLREHTESMQKARQGSPEHRREAREHLKAAEKHECRYTPDQLIALIDAMSDSNFVDSYLMWTGEDEVDMRHRWCDTQLQTLGF